MLQDLSRSWWTLLTQPDTEVVAAEEEKTRLSRVVVAIVLACLLGALVGAQPAEPGVMPWTMAVLRAAGLILAVFAVICLLLFLTARLLGGTGEFLRHAYILAMLAAPGAVILGVLGRMDIRATLLDLVSLQGLIFIVLLLLFIYLFLLLLLALDGVHGFGGRQAFRAVGFVIVAGLVLQVASDLVTDAESPLTRYLLYIVQRRADLWALSLSHARLVLFTMAIAIVLGVVGGVLITFPPKSVRWRHLVLLFPLAAFMVLWFGPVGTWGETVTTWFDAEGYLGFLPRPVAIGMVGTILLLLFYVLYIAGERASDVALYTAGVLLTVPSIALFGIFIPIFGIGFLNAAVALVLYAQLPILRNTYTGIREVSPAVIESARGMGLTEWQILYRIKMPLTMPVIMAGIRISMVMIVGIAAIATLIGVDVLGNLIFDGMQRISNRLVFAGAVGVSVFAILVDILLGWGETLLTPAGLRKREGEVNA